MKIRIIFLISLVISESMKRDEVLRRVLSKQGIKIRFYSFLKGADVNFFIKRGNLEAGIGGDIPALTAAEKDLTGVSMELNILQLAGLVQKDFLGTMFYPVIPASDLKENGHLHKEFEFLQSLGKISASAHWEEIEKNFNLNIVNKVITNPGKYFIYTYNYGKNKKNAE